VIYSTPPLAVFHFFIFGDFMTSDQWPVKVPAEAQELQERFGHLIDSERAYT
jgi:hypothetical protein